MSDLTLINICIGRTLGERILFEWTSEGILSLTAVLNEAGFDVDVREHFTDADREPDDELTSAMVLVPADAELIGIGSHSVHLPFAVKLAARIKGERPEARVFLGGIGPSGVARALMEVFPFLEGVVVGEAEQQIVEVVKRGGRDLEGVPGVVWRRKGDGLIDGGLAPPVDLASIPVPAFAAVDLARYRQPLFMTSRGCPHGCDFCSLGAFWGSSVRYRSMEQVTEVLRWLVDAYGFIGTIRGVVR